ncbi:MAG: PQQ-dependent dehydrogenase, methanol/ethanol family [Parvularculaceae bacterium]
MRRIVILSLALLSLCACGRSDRGAGWIDEKRVASAEAGAGMWLTSGGDAGKTHFSRLDDINRETVSRLGFAWDYQTNTNRGLEATPIVVDGVMYTSGVAGRVYALDAATGAERWTFTPDVDMQVARVVCCDNVNRGVAVWKGIVYVAALDGVLYALNADDGAVLWRADTIDDKSRGYSSTGAPEVAGDIVLIGNAGAEYDARGYVTAYDLKTGNQKWRFYTVPGETPSDDPAQIHARATWGETSRWDLGGGGTVWDAILYDAELNLVYIGVGNGGPYPRAIRSPDGTDNLYLSSIVALRPKTGEVVWHYQETPGDNWDYTATQPMIMTTLDIGGEKTPVLMQAPKNGFFYVLDRRNGKLVAAHDYAKVNWASHVDLETGRPAIDYDRADYSTAPKIVYPASVGAHNWHPMAWDGERGLAYLTVAELGNLLFMTSGPDLPHRAKRINSGAGLIYTPDLPAAVNMLPPHVAEAVRAHPDFNANGMVSRGLLKAFDPVTGETKWEVETSGWWDRSGVLATAGGLIFSGSDTGHMNVYDSDTGALLKSIDIGTSILAAPMTYKIGGVQYVAVMAGWGGGGWGYPHRTSAQYRNGNQGRIIAFRLDGGDAPKPDPLPAREPIPEPPEQFGDGAMIANGQQKFLANCAICHSNMTGSNLPDLRRMTSAHDAFEGILLEGWLKDRGMPQWDDVFSKEDVKEIHAYLIELQRLTYERQQRGEPETDAPIILSNF